MTFTPIFLLILLYFGILHDNYVLVDWSLSLLLIFILTFWLINIIWAVISVRSYNNEIEYNAKRQLDLWNRLHEKDQNQFVVNINQKSSDLNISRQGTIEVSAKPNLQDWLKNNPGKRINDYYSKFGR